jgi:hypothetical protein
LFGFGFLVVRKEGDIKKKKLFIVGGVLFVVWWGVGGGGGCPVCRRVLSLSPTIVANINNKLGNVHLTLRRVYVTLVTTEEQ